MTCRDDWFGILADEFFLRLDDVDADAKDRLWASAAHCARGMARYAVSR